MGSFGLVSEAIHLRGRAPLGSRFSSKGRPIASPNMASGKQDICQLK